MRWITAVIDWLTDRLVWLRRIRHRCGYGIHSPWAFQLVTQVIYNDSAYYAYQPLDRQFHLHGMRRKVARLLFRIANDTQPAVITIPETLPLAEQAYLQAGCRGAEIKSKVMNTSTGNDASDTGLDGQIKRTTITFDDRLTILLDLPRNRTRLDRLQQPGDTTFDLYRLALIYHNLPTPPQHYIINFS